MNKLILSLCLCLSACSCATLKKGQLPAEIVDGTRDTAEAFACVEDPDEAGKLLCVDLEELFLRMSMERVQPQKYDGLLEL